MSERGRARMLAGSMSAISAATIVTVLLGVTVAVSHLAGEFGAGASVGTLRVGQSSIGPPPQQTGTGPTAPAVIASAASSATRPARSAIANALPIHRSRQPRGGPPSSGDVSASAHVGPLQASASAGSDGVTASVAAGPVKKKVHVRTPDPAGQVVGAVQKTVCTLLSC